MTYKLLIKFDDNLPNDIKRYYLEKSKQTLEDTEKDAGFDLICPKDVRIKFGDVGTIDFGIQCAMKNDKGDLVAYKLHTRSSFYKYPLQMTNYTGIIDKGYRGNLMAKIRYCYLNNKEIKEYILSGQDISNHFNKWTNYDIKKDTRMFQLTGPALEDLTVYVVDELPESLRGKKGFGSTGQAKELNVHNQ